MGRIFSDVSRAINKKISPYDSTVTPANNYVLLRWETLAGKVAQYSRGIPRVLALWILFLPISACYANLSLPFLLPSGHRYQPASVPPLNGFSHFVLLRLCRDPFWLRRRSVPRCAIFFVFLPFSSCFFPFPTFASCFFLFAPHFILAQLNRECGNMNKYAKSLASSEVFVRGTGGRIFP